MCTTQGYRCGDRIKGNWRGRGQWYQGTVASVNADGTYRVVYDDGDRESKVKEDRLQKSTFRLGQLVRAKWSGKCDGSPWFAGKITAKNPDGTYQVTYHDGDRDDHVSSLDVHERGVLHLGDPVVVSMGSKCKAEVYSQPVGDNCDVRFEDGRIERVPLACIKHEVP